MVINDIESLTAQALADVAAAQNLDHLEFLRVALLVKMAASPCSLKQLGKLPVEQRKAIGENSTASGSYLGRINGSQSCVGKCSVEQAPH